MMKHRIVFAALMSLVLSFFMTLWVTWLNLGPVPLFFEHWMAAFIRAWPAAGVIAFLMGPPVQKLTVRLTHKHR